MNIFGNTGNKNWMAKLHPIFQMCPISALAFPATHGKIKLLI